MSPGTVAPRGLLLAALVLELPEDALGSRAAGSCAGRAHQPPSVLGLAWALSWTLGDPGHFQLLLVHGDGDAAQLVWCWCGQEAS